MDGQLIFVGGQDQTLRAPIDTVCMLDTGSGTFTHLKNMSTRRMAPGCAPATSAGVFVTGGFDGQAFSR